MPLNVLLLGPQGAGKGTQAKRISAEYGIPHIASGEILRAEMQAGTELGQRVRDVYDRGDLVSDDLVIELIRTRLENYHRETEPLIEYYRVRGNLVPIHGARSENEVFGEIQSALEQVPA